MISLALLPKKRSPRWSTICRATRQSKLVIEDCDRGRSTLYCGSWIELVGEGQWHNLLSSLIVHQDKIAATTGLVNKLALIGMRKLSQEVFALFKRTYIDPRRNFFSEVCDAPVEAFFGEASSQLVQQASRDNQSEQSASSLAQCVSTARSVVKSFVIYQLANSLPPNGAGVGCGHYDESGAEDGGGIARIMNEYVFGFCFNPDINEDNVFHFLDHCLSHLSSPFFSGRDEVGYFASKTELPGGFAPMEMGRYWSQHREQIRERALHAGDRQVVTSNYIASYREDLTGVFAVLDGLVNEATAVKAESDKVPPNQS